MNSLKNQLHLYLIGLTMTITLSFAQTPGFFKDIFCDGGAYLTSMTYFDAAETLDLSLEYLCTSDISFQNSVMVTDEIDSNGHLLYPDGAPRFRMIYTNGGTAGNHGESLGEVGRNRIRTYYANGGSYSGSCAGAYIASEHWAETGTHPYYYHIWPGRASSTGLTDAYTGHFIPAESALLQYFDFGEDLYIDNVRHNGGCYANEQIDYPSRSEVLLRFDYPGWGMHQKASTWAYKPDQQQGRIVVTGSHPESAEDGERLNLMQAILLYALDGVGSPRVKADLINGELRTMDQFPEDNQPEFTRIGDLQYHHFTVMVPPEADTLTIELSAESNFDFKLYANPGDFAFQNTAQFTSPVEGTEHLIQVPVEEAGLWYVGVECISTVTAYNCVYQGQTDVLNGVAYTITATWDTVTVVGVAELLESPSEFELLPNTPNPFNPTTSIHYKLAEPAKVDLFVYDVAGRRITSLVNTHQAAGCYSVQWNGVNQSGNSVSTGVYFCRLNAGVHNQTIKMLYLR